MNRELQIYNGLEEKKIEKLCLFAKKYLSLFLPKAIMKKIYYVE
jgi:hypothetical protein